MPLNVDQIVEETSQWPADVVADLVDHIVLAKHVVDDAPMLPAWSEEIRRHVEDIRSGREPGIPGEEVMVPARRIAGR